MRISDWSSDVCSSDLSLGVFGDHGRGIAEAYGLEQDVDYVVGTFSKSLGAVGGFGVSDNPAFERLRFTSRPYMFTASSSPSSVATALATLGKIKSQPGLRKQLWDNAQALYKGLSDLGFTICAAASPIIAVKRSEEHTSELQSLMRLSYAVFCLKKKI